MNCNKLVFGKSGCLPAAGYVQAWADNNAPKIQIGNLVDLDAVVGNPGDVNDCARSGTVQFLWRDISAGTPAVPVSGGNVYCITPGPANGSPLVPPCSSGAASGTWTPDSTLVPSTPAWGRIIGVVSVNADACDGSTCDAIRSCDTAQTSPFVVWAAAAQLQYAVEALAELTTGSGLMPRYIGFGLGNYGRPTRVVASTLRVSESKRFVLPEVRIAVGKALRVPEGRYHSGPIVPERDVQLAMSFAPCERLSSTFVRERFDDVQAVLEVVWPAESHGARCLLEVREESIERDGKRRTLGRFMLGLRNVRELEHQVWLL